MTDERKYQEEEVKQIFDLASSNRPEIGRPTVSDEGGLTLSELQEVGLEVGMEPGRIAGAALAVDSRREILSREMYWGVPTSTGRIVDLSRALTDREWAVLIGELRETFGGTGEVTSRGGIHGWTNGNLHAFLEPTATGHQLRLRAHKSSAKALITIGAAGLTLGLALLTLFVFEDLGRAAMVIPTLLAGMGGGTLAANIFRLPRWARESEGQMECIAGRVGALVEQQPQLEEPET